MRGMKDDATPSPDADLKDELQAMEVRVRKLRDTRNAFSDQARASADKRNAIQGQYKEHREKVDLVLAEVKAIRAEVKMHKEKRNAIQAQLRDIIGQAKGHRKEKGDKKSATAEYAQLKQEVAGLEKTFETSSVGQKKEKEMIKKIKEMGRRIEELAPEVVKFEMIAVDLSDMDTAIKTLKSEADASHQACSKLLAVPTSCPRKWTKRSPTVISSKQKATDSTMNSLTYERSQIKPTRKSPR